MSPRPGWPDVALRQASALFQGWRLEMRQLLRSKLYLFISLFLPLIFASIAFYMFRGSSREGSVVAIALSASLMSMWSTTLLGSGNAINRLRHQSLLEPLVASPAPTLLFTLPFAVATASLGVYSLMATIAWCVLCFDMPLDIAQPGLFAVAVPVTVLSLGFLGLLLASAFILYPTAMALANLLEYPIWMLSGMLVPVSELPGAMQTAATVLAPTWGVRSIVGSALGTGEPGEAIGMCLLLSVVYLGLASILLRRFEWLARSSGTLALQ